MLRLLCALPITGVLTGFAFLLLTGEYINDGPTVLDVTNNHGLHKGDLFVMAGWAVAMVALLGHLVVPRRVGSPRVLIPTVPSHPDTAAAASQWRTARANESTGNGETPDEGVV